MALPLELKELPRWVFWRFEIRDDKRMKVPFSVTRLHASTTNPSTWAAFADAYAAADRDAKGARFTTSGITSP